MKKLALFSLLILSTVSCGRHCGDATLYQSSGGAKPIVAVLPVIDNSKTAQVSWDLSEELTAKISNRIVDSARLYLLKEKKNVELAAALNHPDPQAIPRNITKNLGAAEYALVTELIDQNMVPISHPKANADKPFLSEVGAELQLAMRVRVIDLRSPEPKVILQEVLFENYEVARPYLFVDYERNCWGKSSFEKTPMGMAHSKLVREIVSHAEGYIGANRR